MDLLCDIDNTVRMIPYVRDRENRRRWKDKKKQNEREKKNPPSRGVSLISYRATCIKVYVYTDIRGTSYCNFNLQSLFNLLRNKTAKQCFYISYNSGLTSSVTNVQYISKLCVSSRQDCKRLRARRRIEKSLIRAYFVDEMHDACR